MYFRENKMEAQDIMRFLARVPEPMRESLLRRINHDGPKMIIDELNQIESGYYYEWNPNWPQMPLITYFNLAETSLPCGKLLPCPTTLVSCIR